MVAVVVVVVRDGDSVAEGDGGIDGRWVLWDSADLTVSRSTILAIARACELL